MKLITRIRENLAFRVFCEFFSRFYMDGVGRAGAGLAYFLLFSFFPLLIFASLLIGTFDINIDTTRALLQGVVPGEVLNFALNYISYVTEVRTDSLMYIGLGASIWTASRAVNSLSVAINRAYRIEKGRNPVIQFLINIGFSAAILAAVVITIVIVIMGRTVLHHLSAIVPISTSKIDAWHILRFAPILILFVLILIALYSIVPNTRIRFRQALPGTAAAAAGWLLASIGFSFYVEHATRYSLLYGSIGAIIVLMIWLHFTGVILIMGAELNHVIYVMHEQKDREQLFDSTQRLPRFQEEERARALRTERREKRRSRRLQKARKKRKHNT